MNSLEFPIAGHRLTLLCSGSEYFPALISAIDAAQHSVHLETYRLIADTSGERVIEALIAAASRSVSVHLLLDGFGSAELPEAWSQRLRAAGVQLRWFRRERGFFSLRRHRFRRLHRKLVLVDEHIAFIGGINLEHDVSLGMSAPRLDYAVRVEGAVTHEIQIAMQRLWVSVSWANLMRRERVASLPGRAELGEAAVQLMLRDNLRHRHDIEQSYLAALAAARQEIIIANAYFLPGRKFRAALHLARKRGVRVVLLLQGQVEYRLQHYATLALYDDFLSAGIEIYEYTHSFLHAKVAVVDQFWTTVGSSNIDPFSLWLAREANLTVKDAAFAGALRAALLREIRENARAIRVSDWRKGHFLGHRALMTISLGIVRFLAGWLGERRDHDDV